MRSKLLLATVFLAAPWAQAQVSAVLIEACNAIADAPKRLECLKAAMQQAPAAAPAVDANAAAIDAADKAFTRMKATVDVGTTYISYGIAVQELAQQLAELKRVGNGLSADGLKALDTALDTYTDAGTFWNTANNFYARSDNRTSFFGGLPVGLNNLQWLVRKYGLPTTNADLLGFHAGLHVANTRSYLWRQAAAGGASGVEALKQAETGKAEAARAEAAARAQQAEASRRAEAEAAAAAEAQRLAKLRFVEVDGLSWQRPVLLDAASAVKLLPKRVEVTTAAGTPVYAAAAGKVSYAGNKLKGFGNMVIVRHEGRYETAYAQNSKLRVAVGDVVTQGQVLADSGETVVYEVRLNGTAANPVPYWPAR